MTQSFFERVTDRARAVDSLLCVGLDPRVSDAASLRAECFRLIDATAEFAVAFKANIAFFEVHGPAGLEALREIIAHVPDPIPVILDAKRGDIAETAEAYARAAFETLGADALTVNPYLGGEALAPFLADAARGAFVLCKTSNPGADEFQELRVDDRALFLVVAEHAQRWNTRGNIGLVVGATDAEALAQVRAVAPETWFLVPGVGAQGGDLESVISAGVRTDGLGLLINLSRALSQASDVRAEAGRLRDAINRFRRARAPAAVPTARAVLAQELSASGCVRFGEFTLKSGIISPIYIDLRRLISHPRLLQRVARAYAGKLRGFQFARLAAIPYAGLPIATAIALELNQPLIFPRREIKEYGTRAAIEGEYAAGEQVVVIDDLATTGDTKIESIRKLESAGLVVRDVVVLIDREQGAREMLHTAGFNLHAVFTLRELLNEWQQSGAMTTEQFARVQEFVEQK